MKDYNEMAKAVFERRDEFVANRKKQRATLLKAGVPLCSVVLIALLTVTLWQSRLPEITTAPTQPTVSTENTQHTNSTEYLQSTDSTEPVESTPENTAGEEEDVPYVPVQTDATVGIDDVPACSPDKPQTGTTPESEDSFVPESPEDPSQAPTIPDEPTLPQEEVPPTDPTEPMYPSTTDPTEPMNPPTTEPTESSGQPVEPTGPLTIKVGEKQYVAQVGDMVTYTAELYVKDYFETFQACVLHDSKLEVVEVVNPNEDDPSPVHFPNLTGGSEGLNYHRDKSSKTEKQIFVTAIRLSGYNFREQKVLFTFDFMVKEPGETEIALEIEELVAKGGSPEYFIAGRQLIFEGINTEEYLTITPKSEVEIPTLPKEEDTEGTTPPFTYPEESFDGETRIDCDGRTYSADVGQRVTYVIELEADEKFEDIQLMIKYGDGLEVFEPNETGDVTAEDIALPNLDGSELIGYDVKYTQNDQVYSGVRLSASSLRRYDFRRRKVLMLVDFIVTKPGEYSIDLVVEEMTINFPKSYFYKGEQKIFEGIEFYTYVVVN